MRQPIEIENIEQLRRQEGIDDVELRDEVRRVRVGDHVRLTFLTTAEPGARETLLVRITRVHAASFRGKLAGRPTRAGLAALRDGAPLAFTRDQIHSVVRGRPPVSARRPAPVR